MPAVDADVVLVTERWDREIDTGHTIVARLGLGVFDRPACVAVLLPQLGWLLRPLRRDAALLDLALLAIGVALLRAATIVASMIWPPIARNPAAESAASKRLNRTSIAGLPRNLARVSASRKVQIVLASGTVPARPSPRKRMNDSRSRIRYSVRSSDRLWLACLFIRRDVQDRIEPLMYGGDQQQGLRPGTLPVPLCAGFGAAMRLMAGTDADAERRRIAQLRDRLVQGLLALDPRNSLNGPPLESRHPGNANLRFSGLDAQDILSSLQPRLAAATGSACTSGNPEPSHVLRAIGLSGEDAQASIRFSLGRFTSPEDVERAVSLVAEAVISCGHPVLAVP